MKTFFIRWLMAISRTTIICKSKFISNHHSRDYTFDKISAYIKTVILVSDEELQSNASLILQIASKIYCTIYKKRISILYPSNSRKWLYKHTFEFYNLYSCSPSFSFPSSSWYDQFQMVSTRLFCRKTRWIRKQNSCICSLQISSIEWNKQTTSSTHQLWGLLPRPRKFSCFQCLIEWYRPNSIQSIQKTKFKNCCSKRIQHQLTPFMFTNKTKEYKLFKWTRIKQQKEWTQSVL